MYEPTVTTTIERMMTGHHVVERGLEGATAEPHGDDGAARISTDGARRAGDPRRATERRYLQARRVRGGSESASGFGESQRRKAFHVAQHRARL